MKNRNKLLLICLIIVLILFFFSLILYLVVQIDKVLVLVIIQSVCLLLSLLCYIFYGLNEKRILHQHVIDDYDFIPVNRDHIHDMRLLIDDKPLENSKEEKDKIDICFEKTYQLEKKNCAYLIRKNNIPIGILNLKNKKRKEFLGYEILYAKEEVDNKIIEQLIKEENLILKKE